MTYTVAIVTDIHGNLAGLDAVLADLDTQPHDQLVVAGDLLANGPWPAETVRRLQTLSATVVYGNMDEAVIQATPSEAVCWWARQQIGEAGVAYLKGLPFSHRITPPGGQAPQADLLVVHATPRNVEDVLILTPEPAGTTFVTATPEAEAAPMLADTVANLIVYGHIHYFSSGEICGQRLASLGSAGFPFDGDQRAAYALVRWDGHAWQVEPRRVRYDAQATVDAIRRSGQPFAERYAQMILQAKWLPPSLFIN